MDVFLTKYVHESRDFFVKNWKKGHPIDFFGPSYSVVLTELTFFLPNMGLTAGSFRENFEKLTSEHSVFERQDVF